MKKIVLLDFSNIAHASFHSITKEIKQTNAKDPLCVERIQVWRYFMLDKIKETMNKHKPHELIICCDKPSWRKKAFPYYKAKRKQSRDQSELDYQQFYEEIDRFLNDIDMIFPYKVLSANGAEADDIIGILTHSLKDENEILIVSVDKDMVQLLDTNVRVWCPNKKAYQVCDDTDRFLVEHILKGDSSDGIPNILCPDDTYIRESYKHTKGFINWMMKKTDIKDLDIEYDNDDSLIEYLQENHPKAFSDTEDKYREEFEKEPIAKERATACGSRKINEILEYGLEKYIKENKLNRNYNRNKKLIQLDEATIPKKLWDYIMKRFDKIGDKKYNELKILQFIKRNKLRLTPRDIKMFKPEPYNGDISDIF